MQKIIAKFNFYVFQNRDWQFIGCFKIFFKIKKVFYFACHLRRTIVNLVFIAWFIFVLITYSLYISCHNILFSHAALRHEDTYYVLRKIKNIYIFSVNRVLSIKGSFFGAKSQTAISIVYYCQDLKAQLTLTTDFYSNLLKFFYSNLIGKKSTFVILLLLNSFFEH